MLASLLDGYTVHRAERAAQLTGAPLSSSIAQAVLVKLLTHPEGGLKGMPAAARRVALPTQRAAGVLPWAEVMVAALRRGGFERVVVLDLRTVR